MSIRSKIVDLIAGPEIEQRVKAIQARYEAAYWTKQRSYLPGYIQSAREDVNTMSRQEILRRTRYFEKNNNVMKKVLSILDVNVIGSGINPTPATADADWSKWALDWWNSWSQVADVTRQQTVSQMQSVIFRAQNVDGDHGLQLLLNEYGRPALSLVEAHRIGAAGIDARSLESMGYKVVDGVIIDWRGRPLSYAIAAEFDSAGISPVNASDFILFFTKSRASQYRGISLFHAAVLDLHDLDDLQKFEMLAAKDAASISKVVQTAAGAATSDGTMIGSDLVVTDNIQPGNRDAYYRQALGAETIYTYPGDKYEQFKSERPSAATSGFWDKLENKFVQGSGLSYAALVDYRGNWGGATLRAAVTADNRLFSLRTQEQASKWQRVWEFAIGWAQDHGELPRNPDFRNVRWHPPRKTTVDIGHESDAMLNELKAGLRTYEGTYGEAGDDWKERLEQRAKEEQFIEVLAKKYAIPRQLIASFAQERLAGTAPDSVGDPSGLPAKQPNQ